MLTKEKLREILEFRDGDFYWLVNTGNKNYIGKKAGKIGINGYIYICINYTSHLMHRLVWLYYHGYMPVYIDHKDGNQQNNMLWNLREATMSQNQANGMRERIGYEVHGRKYRVRIGARENRVTIGSFDTPEEAQQAFVEAHKRIYGEFSVFNRGEVRRA